MHDLGVFLAFLSTRLLAASFKKHSISDVVGALFFIASAAFILRDAAQFSILLLPSIAYEVLAATSFLIWRTAPKRQPIPWYARATAYSATFAFPILVTLAEMWRPQCLAPTLNSHLRAVGGCLWIFGCFFGLWALWHLRRSFSIEPEARELSTGGPYKIARHPIYTSRILLYTGILIMRPSVPLALIYLIWFGLMFVRTRFEEQVLQSAFPAYEAYRRQVGMFAPRLFKRPSQPQLQEAPSAARPAFAVAPATESYSHVAAMAPGQSVGGSNWPGLGSSISGPSPIFRTLSGILLSVLSAFVIVRMCNDPALSLLVPLFFIPLLVLLSSRFGTMVSVVGSVLAALIFAWQLYPPIGSIHVESEVARTRLGLMIVLSVVGSFLLFHQHLASTGQVKH